MRGMSGRFSYVVGDDAREPFPVGDEIDECDERLLLASIRMEVALRIRALLWMSLEPFPSSRPPMAVNPISHAALVPRREQLPQCKPMPAIACFIVEGAAFHQRSVGGGAPMAGPGRFQRGAGKASALAGEEAGSVGVGAGGVKERRSAATALAAGSPSPIAVPRPMKSSAGSATIRPRASSRLQPRAGSKALELNNTELTESSI
jgi:hypothetical protein